MALMQSSVHRSAGALGLRPKGVSLAVVAKFGRRPCKPICFKENTGPDSIDQPAPRRPTTTAQPGTPGAPATSSGTTPAYGTDQPVTTPAFAALRQVNLGPVATVMYPALSLGTAVASLAAMLAPGAVGSLLFRGAVLTATQKLLIFCAGAALIPTFVSKRRIQAAAQNGILASPAFKQMVSACLLHGVLGLLVLCQAVSLRNPILAATVGGLTGLATITTSYTLMKIRESGQLVPTARGLLGGVLSLLAPANLTATAYSVATIAALGMGAVLLTVHPATPCFMFVEPHEAIHVFATRITGAAAFATAVLLFTVKQAADDGRQGSPVYKDINGGVAAYSTLTTAALAYALATGLAKSAPGSWGYLAAAAATAALTAYNWYAAPEA